MSAHTVIHVWGFYDDDGNPRTPNNASSEEGTNACNAFTTVRSNVVHFGGDIANLRITRTLDGWMVGADFDTPERNQAARMWHRIFTASKPWPSKSNPTREDTR